MLTCKILLSFTSRMKQSRTPESYSLISLVEKVIHFWIKVVSSNLKALYVPVVFNSMVCKSRQNLELSGFWYTVLWFFLSHSLAFRSAPFCSSTRKWNFLYWKLILPILILYINFKMSLHHFLIQSYPMWPLHAFFPLFQIVKEHLVGVYPSMIQPRDLASVNFGWLVLSFFSVLQYQLPVWDNLPNNRLM